MRLLLDARVRAGGPQVYARHLIAGLKSAGEPAHTARVLTGFGPWLSPWGRARVSLTAATWSADLVHGLHVELAPSRVSSVATIHDLVPLEFPASLPNPLARRLYRRALAVTLRRASRVIVPSPATKDRLVAHGVDEARVAVVPLAAGTGFRPLDPAQRGAARMAFAGGRRYVVASTGRRFHKNLEGLGRAATLLSSDVAVAVTGTSAIPGVTSVGPLGNADLARFYGGAEAVVLPAFVEGFGLPALEALACGVPVICGPDVGAAAYLRSGMLEVDVRSTEELAEAVRTLLGDDALRRRLGTAGRAAAAPLTVGAMATATLAVYRDVLG